MNKANLKTARSIIGSFSVNVRMHPEYLVTSDNGCQTCDRNYLVANAMLAIDELAKSL